MHLDSQHVDQNQRQRQVKRQMIGLAVKGQAHGRKQKGKSHHSIAVGGIAAPKEGQPELIQRQQQTERPQRRAAGLSTQGQLLTVQQQPQARAHGSQRRNQRERRGNMRFKARPVGANQIVEVGRVQRGVGIGRKGLLIQADQPSRRLPHGKGHDDGRGYEHRQSKAQTD